MPRKTHRKIDPVTVVGILFIVGMVIAAFAIQSHREARMNAYAVENDCTWHYDYYINKQPVCK